MQAAEESIVRRKTRQPEWYENNVEKLTPLLDAKNATHDRMLGSNSAETRRAFRQAQWRVKSKEGELIVQRRIGVARETQEVVKGGKTCWECIRRLQQAHAG